MTKRNYTWCTTGLLVGFVSQSDAIVTRHDRTPEAFLDLSKKITMVCTVAGNGEGTLIGPRWVLTAAHVAASATQKGATIRLGERTYPIHRVIIHPGGTAPPGQPAEDDIALIELSEEVKDITPAELFRDSDENGQTIIVAGHGDIGDGQTSPRRGDGKLRAATNVITDAGPKRLFFVFDAPPNGTNLEGVSGPGDSGGPALLEKDDKLFVVGVSSGATGGKPGRYGVTEVYMRVSKYVEWIDQTMRGGS